MKGNAPVVLSRRAVFLAALKYSVPVFLGYTAIGIAFGFMITRAGYPWWLAPATCLWMYAGAGQFIALGLFTAGTNIWEACLVQLVVNIRHTAYGFSMLKRFRGMGPFKPYLVFSLTDETFALLSSMPEMPEEERRHFMIYVAALDQFYWTGASTIGALAGALIPFEIKGISFALTALFVVLMVEQIRKIKTGGVFIVSAGAALLGVFILPGRVSLLAALALALFLSALVERIGKRGKQEK